MTTLAFRRGHDPHDDCEGRRCRLQQRHGGRHSRRADLSLLLTLLATPVIYSIFDDAIHFARSPRETRRQSREKSRH
jgi:HAE1 family hydrophobic/amphiphilic exporter-1